MNTFIKACLGGLLLMFLLFSCEKDTAIQPVNLLSSEDIAEIAANEVKTQVEVDLFLSTLVQAPNLGSMTTAERTVFLYNNHPSGNIDISAMTTAYNDAYSQVETALSQPTTPYFEKSDDLFYSNLHKPSEGVAKLEAYQAELIGNSTDLSKTELLAVIDDVIFKKSFLKSSWLKDLLTILGIPSTVIILDTDNCTLLGIELLSKLASCATGKPISCLTLPFKLAKFFNKCVFDLTGPRNWCDFTPDPCCGVRCVTGFVCDGLTGDCVDDPNNNPCDDCGPGQVCFSGRCVDL